MYVINLVVLFGMHILETSCTHHVKVKKKDNEMGETFPWIVVGHARLLVR